MYLSVSKIFTNELELPLIKFGCTKMMTNTDNLEFSLLTSVLLQVAHVEL